MKQIAIAVSVVGLVFGVAILAKTQTESIEQELINLENESNNAWAKLFDVSKIRTGIDFS